MYVILGHAAQMTPRFNRNVYISNAVSPQLILPPLFLFRHSHTKIKG